MIFLKQSTEIELKQKIEHFHLEISPSCFIYEICFWKDFNFISLKLGNKQDKFLNVLNLATQITNKASKVLIYEPPEARYVYSEIYILLAEMIASSIQINILLTNETFENLRIESFFQLYFSGNLSLDKFGDDYVKITPKISTWENLYENLIFLPKDFTELEIEKVRDNIQISKWSNKNILFLTLGDAKELKEYLEKFNIVLQSGSLANQYSMLDEDEVLFNCQIATIVHPSIKNIFIPDTRAFGLRVLQAKKVGWFKKQNVQILPIKTTMDMVNSNESYISVSSFETVTKEELAKKIFEEKEIEYSDGQNEFTVTIPCYNSDLNFIKQLCYGLNSQTLKPNRILFINDGSKKGYEDILKETVSQVLNSPFEILNQENRGLAGVRNSALENVKTPYMVNLDSDVVPMPDFFEQLVNAISNKKDSIAAVGYYKAFKFGSEEKIELTWVYRPIGDGRVLGLINNCLGDTNGIYNVDNLRKIGGWDDSDRSRLVDWALFLKAISLGFKITVVPKELLLYRLHTNSVTLTQKIFPAYLKLIRNALFVDRVSAFMITSSIQELSQTKQELSQTKQELSQTKQELSQTKQELGISINEIQSLYLSRSWRLTSSFRKITELIRGIRDYYIIWKSGMFDNEFYLKEYSDVKIAEMNPLWHFVRFGWREGRTPNPLFNSRIYLRGYWVAKINHLNHFLAYFNFLHFGGGNSLSNCRPINEDGRKFTYLEFLELREIAFVWKNQFKKVTLYINTVEGGGTKEYLERTINLEIENKELPILYNPEKMECFFYVDKNNIFKTSCEYSMIEKIIDYNKIILVSTVFFREIKSFLPILHKAILKRKKEFIIQIHDYYILCPSLNLLNKKGKYCNLPDISVCDSCLKKNPYSFKKDEKNVRKWRNLWSSMLDCSSKIEVFSKSSFELLKKIYPNIEHKIKIKPHNLNYLTRLRPPLNFFESPSIGVLGEISYHKGSNIVRSLSKVADTNGTSLKVIGNISFDSNSWVNITGGYKIEDLPKIIEKEEVNIFLVPSICPETFCYVVDELIKMDLPVVCFNLGAQKEKIENYKKGRVIQLGMPVEKIYEELVDLFKETYGKQDSKSIHINHQKLYSQS